MKSCKIALCVLAVLVVGINRAEAANNCSFAVSGSIMTLNGDCTTDASIVVPNGVTLDGNGFTLTAVDPAGGHFTGAVIRNGGAIASVINLMVTGQNLVNACDAGNARLRGIMFDGASGVISGNVVVNINQGASGCQEGNAIEVRSCDGAGMVNVEVAHNTVSSWQKTGIVINCNALAWVHHNTVNASATQANLAANSIQIGFGASATVEHNQVAGNSWTTNADWASSAILLYQAAPGTLVRQNNFMDGNADVGIWIESSGVTVDNNRVFESGADGAFDIGIGNWGMSNSVTNNKVRGYAIPVDGDSVKTKAIPSPHEG